MTHYNLLTSYPMKNNQLTTISSHIQILIKKRIYHPQLISNQNHLVNILHFRTNKIHQKPITTSENQTYIHDYNNFINPRRHAYNRYNFRPQPRKDYRLFLGEKDIISLSQKSC